MKLSSIALSNLLLINQWGAFSVVLKAIEMLNKQRDIVLGISENYHHVTIAQKEIILNGGT